MSKTAKIIGLIKSKDEKGLEMLYDSYSHALYGIAIRVLNHEEYAEEALQNSFLKIWKNIHQFDQKKASLYTWMAQIVRNASLDIRRLKSFKNENKTETIEVSVHSKEVTTIGEGGIDAERLLMNLDSKYQIVLEYLYLKGYTQQELAEEMNIPLGTIKTRLRKAISILRENLKDEEQLFLGIVFMGIVLIIIKNLWF